VHAEVDFGFVEIPDLQQVLSETKNLPERFDLKTAVFFGTRDQVVRRKDGSRMDRVRLPLFAFLYRNAVKLVDRFNLPPENVVEIARQIEI